MSSGIGTENTRKRERERKKKKHHLGETTTTSSKSPSYFPLLPVPETVLQYRRKPRNRNQSTVTDQLVPNDEWRSQRHDDNAYTGYDTCDGPSSKWTNGYESGSGDDPAT
jgi:hypothetical protein